MNKPEKSWPTPFVTGLDKSTHESSDNHDFIDEQSPDDCWPWETSSEKEIHQKERSGDDPIDVTSVENFTIDTSDVGLRATELDVDGSPAQVGAHGEVGDCRNQVDTSSDVEEDAICAGFHCARRDDGECSEAHGSTDGEIDVGASSSNGDVDMFAILSVGVDLWWIKYQQN